MKSVMTNGAINYSQQKVLTFHWVRLLIERTGYSNFEGQIIGIRSPFWNYAYLFPVENNRFILAPV